MSVAPPDPVTPNFDYIDLDFVAEARRKYDANGRSWSTPEGYTAPPLDHLIAFAEWAQAQSWTSSTDLRLAVVFGLRWSSSIGDRLGQIMRERIFPSDLLADEIVSTYKACGSIAETARRIEVDIGPSMINRGLYQEAFTRRDWELLAQLYSSGSGWSVGSTGDDADELDEIDGSGWIYAYSFPAYQRLAEMDESPTMPIKVGMTRVTPEARVYGQTRTSHPEDPVILGTWQFADEAMAYRVERSFQRRFANSKLSGRTVGDEWFDTSLDAVKAALSMASDLLGDPTT